MTIPGDEMHSPDYLSARHELDQAVLAYRHERSPQVRARLDIAARAFVEAAQTDERAEALLDASRSNIEDQES